MLIGVDYHPSFQTIAYFVEETGEYDEQELNHSDGQAERFYRDLKHGGISVWVGMEATGSSRWFVDAAKAAGFDVSKSFGFYPFTPKLPNLLGDFVSFKGC